MHEVMKVLLEAVTNKYFIYALIIATIFIIIKSTIDYKAYISDCKILNQKPKPLGYIINTGMNIIIFSMIIHFAFVGYTAFKDDKIINNNKTYKISHDEKKIYKKKHIKPTYTIKKVTTNNKPTIKHNQQRIIIKQPKKQTKKPITERIRAKEKLKRELEQAIENVN